MIVYDKIPKNLGKEEMLRLEDLSLQKEFEKSPEVEMRRKRYEGEEGRELTPEGKEIREKI